MRLYINKNGFKKRTFKAWTMRQCKTNKLIIAFNIFGLGVLMEV